MSAKKHKIEDQNINDIETNDLKIFIQSKKKQNDALKKMISELDKIKHHNK